MFGYITIHEQELKVREAARYRSFYCGLCDTLHRRYGRRGQMLLSYDMTFLVILLYGLYEPGEETTRERCIVHPARCHSQTVCEATEYAADMTVLLAYQKGADDWADERSPRGRAVCSLLRKDYLALRERYPRQSGALERDIARGRRLERACEKAPADWTMLDGLSGVSGHFLGEICAPREDLWKQDLRRVGFYLGKAVYLMDAYEDMEKDEKAGSFNLLLRLRAQDPEGFEAHLDTLLSDTMACAARSFERLPILEEAQILRNILYAGIWTRYAAIRRRREEAAQ